MRYLVILAMLAGCAPVAEHCRPRAGSIEQMLAPSESHGCEIKPKQEDQDIYTNPD